MREHTVPMLWGAASHSRRAFFGVSGAAVAGALGVAELRPKAHSTPLPSSVFDVRQIGAQGDGQHNDREAIQRAIEATRATDGGIVFFPAGTYRVEGPLECDDRRSIQFIGVAGHLAGLGGGSTLKFAGTHKGPRWSARSSVGLYFRGLTLSDADPAFDGHIFDFAHSSPTAPDGGNHTFAYCTFSGTANTASLLNLNEAIDNEVSHCGFWNGRYGLLGRTSSYTDSCVVDGCSFNAQTVQSLHAPGNGWSIRGCTFEPLADGAISGIGCADHQVRGLVVEGCWFGDSTGGTCVRLSGEGLFVAGNFFGSGDVGIACDASHTVDGAVILGNRFSTIVGIDLAANFTGVQNRGIFVCGNGLDGSATPIKGEEGVVDWALVRNSTIADVYDSFVSTEFRAPVTFQSADFQADVLFQGAKFQAHVAMPAGMSTKVISSPPGPMDTAPDGTIWVSSSDSRIYIRLNGRWKSVVLA
jgi:pectate lyase-like protein